MKKYIAIAAAILITIVVASVLKKQGVTPGQVTEYGNIILSMFDENGRDVLYVTHWTEEQANAWSNDNAVAVLKYGRIMEATQAMNASGIKNLFVYVPTVPFPTSNVVDHVLASGIDTNLSASLYFYLNPDPDGVNRNIVEVATAKGR